jgi:hypothetical protein
MSRKKWNGLQGARLVAALLLTGSLLLAAAGMATASPGPVGQAANFEDDDGNMPPQPNGFDWNSFAPIQWNGTAPYRTSDHVDAGWTFKGIEDAVVTNSDTAFAGGTKQDAACPTVNTGKAPNKDDLQRVYVASKVINGRTYLMLAWHRIPQNTTSPSAHIGFEFNSGTDGLCGGSSDGLVKRVEGDFLVVYDFEGGSTNTPVITLRRWVTSGACEVGSDSPPCWGPAANLTALGFAEAKVNTSDVQPFNDDLSPDQPDGVGVNEFGEAGIDLTGAGVFPVGTCESFGSVFAVSRSSGNSGTAQMKDIDGPADFTIANCGTVTIRKVTDPSGDTNTNFTFRTDVTTDTGNSVSDFMLMDGQHKDIFNVDPGTGLNVTETNPGPNYLLTNIDCSASNTTSQYSTDTSTRAVTFDITAGDILDCTFTNTLQRGAIKITKTTTKGGGGLDGATFSIVRGTPINGSPFTTANGGTICVDNLPFGDYTVTETGAPTGYKINDTTGHTVTVDNNAKCSDATYVGETISFDDTPLSQIEVKFTSLAGAGVTNASIVCEDSTPTVINAVSENGAADPALDDTDETFTNLAPGTYTCTVVVDP